MDRMQGTPKISLSPDMIKKFKTITCDCGGVIFETAIVFKVISAIISPSGKEEMYPLEVLVCKKCGKVPNEFNKPDILPDEILATKQIIK